jgi:hypothetical protein
MSDYSKDHTKQMPGKSRGANMAPPAMGTKERPAHKHPDKMVALGEGLDIGSVHPAHTKESVVQIKHNQAPPKASKMQRERAIAGNANPMGHNPVANQKTGHGGSLKENPAVRGKAYGYNKRSEQGGADPMAVAGCE